MSEFFSISHIFWASFCSLIHIFRFQGECTPHQGLILCLCGAVSAPLPCADPARYLCSNRTEHLLIYRIPSHTNPKRRDFSLKQPGQKSAKEEGPEQRKGPKRAVNGSLKVQTHVWEQDAGCSSHLTPTNVCQKYRLKWRFFCVSRPLLPGK